MLVSRDAINSACTNFLLYKDAVDTLYDEFLIRLDSTVVERTFLYFFPVPTTQLKQFATLASDTSAEQACKKLGLDSELVCEFDECVNFSRTHTQLANKVSSSTQEYFEINGHDFLQFIERFMTPKQYRQSNREMV